jgi:hypothetical protein
MGRRCPGLSRVWPLVTPGVLSPADGVTFDAASVERERTGVGTISVGSAASHRLQGDRDHGNDEDHADHEETGYPDDGQQGRDHPDNLVRPAARLLTAPRLRSAPPVALPDPAVPTRFDAV